MSKTLVSITDICFHLVSLYVCISGEGMQGGHVIFVCSECRKDWESYINMPYD